MNEFLTYIFYPNPANADYTNPKAIVLLLVCVLFVVASFVVPRMRNRSADTQFKKISRTWATACGWFGWSGLVLVIARVEEIQFISMRFMWVIWGIALAAYLALQVRNYRVKYYQIIPSKPTEDVRAKYLPTKKKR